MFYPDLFLLLGALMYKWKSLIFHLIIGGVCLLTGFWLGNWWTEKKSLQSFYFSQWHEVKTRIKTLDMLYKNDTENAIFELERQLDMNAIAVGPNEYQPHPLSDDARSILQMIAKHRNTHPFSSKNHPGIDDMVQKTLQSAK